jgi:hypothetical protein
MGHALGGTHTAAPDPRRLIDERRLPTCLAIALANPGDGGGRLVKFRARARTTGVLKMGRTQLQDAVP